MSKEQDSSFAVRGWPAITARIEAVGKVPSAPLAGGASGLTAINPDALVYSLGVVGIADAWMGYTLLTFIDSLLLIAWNWWAFSRTEKAPMPPANR